MWELFWSKQNTDVGAALDGDNVNDVEFYNYYGTQVHKSRVIIMKGMTAPSFIRPRLRGWGFSMAEPLVRSLNQYLKKQDLDFELIDECKVDVYKIKNLSNSLLSPGGEAAIKKRIEMANWQKNYQHALVMDSEDDFDHKQLSFAGLAEVMQGIRIQVAADMRMPITKLFGISAAGFNSGEDDIEVYNAMVESQVRNKCKYEIIKLIGLKCQQLFGFVPDDLDIKFQSLRILGAEQEENVKNSKFTRLLQAKQAGEITRFEFREGCNKDTLLSITLDTTGDELNPDDPDVASLVAGEDDVESPSRQDEGDDPDEGDSSIDGGGTSSQLAAKEAKEAKQPKKAKNSIEYDVKAYLVDGGDGILSDRRKPFFDDPYKYADKGLYEKAKEASQIAFGKHNWKFVAWWYRHKGGAMIGGDK
jgi:hypothetical protein